MNITFEHLGMEAIDFQSNQQLRKELAIYFTQLKATPNDQGAQRAELLKKVSNSVKARTGINVVFMIDEGDYYNCFIYPQHLSREHPLHPAKVGSRLMQPNVDLLSDKAIGGSVDLKTGKVSGVFSEMVFVGGFTDKCFTSDLFTGDELAAMALHELGHLVAYFELLGHSIKTNWVLYEVSRAFTESADKNARVDVLNTIENYYGTKFEDKNHLAENGHPEMVGAVVVANAMNRLRNEIGTKYYDARAWEFLSDQFATRHGAGRDLVTALDKVGRAAGIGKHHAYYSTSNILIINAVGLAFAMFTVNLGQTMIGGTRLAVSFGLRNIPQSFLWALGATLGLNLLRGVKSSSSGIYDAPADRYLAIRRELVGSLKTLNLSMAQQKTVLEDLLVIDEAVKSLNSVGDIQKQLISFIWDTMTGSRKELQFQQQYEKLVNNELYVKAAQLNQLT